MTGDDLAARAILSALRSGVVPSHGLDRLVTGLDALEAAFVDELDFVATGKGTSKWLNGAYGAGKTFAARYLCARARTRGFATAEVQVSVTETPLHRLEAVYRRLVERLETSSDGPNAFRAIVDAWLYRVGNEVTELQGLEENDPRMADAIEQRLEDKLAGLSRRAPAFAQVLRAYYRALHDADFRSAQGLLAWLGGQPHTERVLLKKAGVRGAVDGQAALNFLSGLLQLLQELDMPGLVLVLDEVETLQRLPQDARAKSLNVLRQLVDGLAAGQFPGLCVILTGTPEFFTGARGIRALPPLHQRVQADFGDEVKFDNLRAPQVRLPPFDEERLLSVGRKVRTLYPAGNPERLERRIDAAFLRDFVKQVTSAFGGQVALAPRMFLRELVDVMDRVDQHEDFDPRKNFKLVLAADELTAEERAAVKGGRAPAAGG